MHPHDLWILRHGETEWNRAHRWQGRHDSPLTEAGEAQATQLGALLVNRGITPDSHRFVTSPQGRAARTAALILDAIGSEAGAETNNRLSEIDVGDWTGLTRDEIGAPATGDAFLDIYARAPGGEGFDALDARARAVLASLDGPAVLITHGITSRFLRAAALGLGRERAEDIPGGQGVAHRLSGGTHETIDAATGSTTVWTP